MNDLLKAHESLAKQLGVDPDDLFIEHKGPELFLHVQDSWTLKIQLNPRIPESLTKLLQSLQDHAEPKTPQITVERRPLPDLTEFWDSISTMWRFLVRKPLGGWFLCRERPKWYDQEWHVFGETLDIYNPVLDSMYWLPDSQAALARPETRTHEQVVEAYWETMSEYWCIAKDQDNQWWAYKELPKWSGVSWYLEEDDADMQAIPEPTWLQDVEPKDSLRINPLYKEPTGNTMNWEVIPLSCHFVARDGDRQWYGHATCPTWTGEQWVSDHKSQYPFQGINDTGKEPVDSLEIRPGYEESAEPRSQEMVVNWDKMPEGFNFIARDGIGRWSVFRDEPTWDESIREWLSEGPWMTGTFVLDLVESYSGDPEDSLIQRPEAPKLESVQMDWTQVPEGCDFVAYDGNGIAYAYAGKPLWNISTQKWNQTSGLAPACVLGASLITGYHGKPEDSLMVRPKLAITKEPVQVDWSQVPEGLDWIAMDDDDWFAYVDKPIWNNLTQEWQQELKVGPVKWSRLKPDVVTGYQGIPANSRMQRPKVQVDWDQVPEGCDYIVQCINGRWLSLKERPTWLKDMNIWKFHDIGKEPPKGTVTGYIGKPENSLMTRPKARVDWDRLSSRYICVAQTRDGEWRAFHRKPRWDGEQKEWLGQPYCSIARDIVTGYTGKPEDSLIEHP